MLSLSFSTPHTGTAEKPESSSDAIELPIKAVNLEIIINFMIQGDPNTINPQTLTDSKEILSFCDKFRLLVIARLVVDDLAKFAIYHSREVFIIASQYDDERLARVAVGCMCHDTSMRNYPMENLPSDDIKRCEPRYIAALLRTLHKVSNKNVPMSSEMWRTAANHFNIS